ncbi:MAG: hypothetical protein JKY26_17600 [Pseudomonas sp.]|nr:hypothetical protein [Pseudomonas sp.]
MTKSFLTELRDLQAEHAAHEGNIRLLQQAMPKLGPTESHRARNTVQNLQTQQKQIDRLLLRAECDKEI